MDTLLEASSMAKRPCVCANDPGCRHSHCCINPKVSQSDQMEDLLEAFLEFSDSSALSLHLSFEKLLDSRTCDSDQTLLIDRALRLGSALLEAGKRSARKRASIHNSLTWPLPPDLTIKVFSMLDTQSLCYAAATCSMFHKCAMDPLCYANIDLTTVVPKVNNAVVSTMIQRAGKVLKSLRLGIVPGPTLSAGSSQPLVYTIRNSVDAAGFSWNDKRSRQGKESSILTRSCLTALSGDTGAAGALLRRLHLYNIERMDNTALCAALSACPSLLDLEIVGLHVELRQTLMSVSKNCHLIERLFFESSKTGRDDSLKALTCVDLVNNCPYLTSLALRGFKLHDYKVRILVKLIRIVAKASKTSDCMSRECEMDYMFNYVHHLSRKICPMALFLKPHAYSRSQKICSLIPFPMKGFQKLKYVDFSTSYSITGTFLRNLGSSTGGNLLEVLILRDCMHLKEVEVAKFLSAILAGDFRLLRLLDISNREGLASEGDWYYRCYNSSMIPLKQVSEERPDICLVAEFPSEGSIIEIEQMIDILNSDASLSSHLSGHSSESSVSMSSSGSSYNSDQGSGNEDGRDAGYVIYEESSDEVDILAV